MGDLRFERPLGKVKRAADVGAAIRALSDVDVIAALAAASRDQEPYLANVLATEALNRVRRTVAISKHLGEGVFAVDSLARFTFLNSTAQQALGWTADELAGKPLTTVLRDDGDVRTVLQEGGTRRSRLASLTPKGGTPFPVSMTISAITPERSDDEGLIDGAIVIFQDITTRLAEERQAQERAARLVRQNAALTRLARARENAFETAIRMVTETVATTLNVDRVVVWTYGAEDKVLIGQDVFHRNGAVPASVATLGHHQSPMFFDALESKRLIAATNARDDPRTSELADCYLSLNRMNAILAAAVHVGGEWRGAVTAESASGNHLWHEDEQSFVSSVASVVAVLMEARERARTEAALRQSEAFHRALVDAADWAGTGIVVYGGGEENASLIFANAAAKALLGATEDLLRERTWETFVTPDEALRLAAWGEAARREEPVPRSFVTTILRPDGTVIPVRVGLGQLMMDGKPASVAALSPVRIPDAPAEDSL